jgi:hypothetical protein
MALTDRRPVSGCYRGASGRLAVELRVDVDGSRATCTVSADYQVDDAYSGSMRIDRPSVVFHQNMVTIRGSAVFSYPTPFTAVRVTIPRVPEGAERAQATLMHFTRRGVPGSRFTCRFHSESFRTILLEEAYQHDVRRFEEYDTSLLPSAGANRTLSATVAFAEAGIELQRSRAPSPVDTAIAGPNHTWSDAELHAAMELYFTGLAQRPQWAIWLMHARVHDDPRLRGLMFDRRGLHRQGCAVFYESMADEQPPTLRNQLHTCVHELGHGFNLAHSWQKVRATPPVPSRPDAASWMNYPFRYPGGEPAYWPAFAFEFDEPELVHLRHGFQEDVIMGGRPFLAGAASETGEPDPHERHNPGLRLALTAPREFRLGMPVSVELALHATTAAGQLVSKVIGPRPGNVDIYIRRPDGIEVAFEPLLRHCREAEPFLLTARSAPLRDYAFIHYGKDGYAFGAPGRYRVRAVYTALDGSVVHSGSLPIVVARAATRDERTVGGLVLGDDGVGKLMSLMGSAAPALDSARDTLGEIVKRHPRHPMSDVARVVMATSAARDFKVINPDGVVEVRRADIEAARDLVAPVIDFAAVERAAPAGLTGAEQEQALASALSRVGTREGVQPMVDTFVNSRRLEIAKVVPKREAPPSPAGASAEDRFVVTRSAGSRTEPEGESPSSAA